MNLIEFKNTINKDIEDFTKMWEEGKRENPQHFPNEMNEGDWLDQFLIFLNTEK